MVSITLARIDTVCFVWGSRRSNLTFHLCVCVQEDDALKSASAVVARAARTDFENNINLLNKSFVDLPCVTVITFHLLVLRHRPMALLGFH